MRSLLAICLSLIGLLLLPALCAQTPAPPTESQLCVMSWNMQSNGKRNGRVQEEADPTLLAEQMRTKTGVDIWGLSEVYDRDAAELFRKAAADASGANFELLLGSTANNDKLAILYNADRLELEHKFELRRVQVDRKGLRAPLVARFRGKTTGQRFLFMVNHLLRGGNNARDRGDHLEQALLLNDWVAEEVYPIIAVGDYNFDVEVSTRRGKPPFHAMIDGPFRWLEPLHLVKTQADDRYDTVLDFVFVANEDFAPGWSGKSTIMSRRRNAPALRRDFDDDGRNSDHRPVRATFTFYNAPEVEEIASDDGKTLQVGSFNIELLGSDRRKFERQPRPRRSVADLEELADRIALQHDLEVVVLQEINTKSTEWATLRGRLKQHGYRFYEGTASGRNQFVVLAWDADEVEVVADSLQELQTGTKISSGDSCDVDGLRLPVAGRFRCGTFDFWVVGVHLKSRSTRSSGSQACNTFVRKTQCQRLVEQVNRLVADSGERDVLLIGDFNERSGHESFDPLSDAGFRSQMDFLAPGSALGSYIKSRRPTRSRDLIDQVFLRFGDTQEVVRNSAFVYRPPNDAAGIDFVRRQSDHVPVWVSFERVDRD